MCVNACKRLMRSTCGAMGAAAIIGGYALGDKPWGALIKAMIAEE